VDQKLVFSSGRRSAAADAAAPMNLSSPHGPDANVS
jgi:hypothetical protein